MRGAINFSQNSFEISRIDFEKALKINPNFSETCFGLGQYFFANAQYKIQKQCANGQ